MTASVNGITSTLTIPNVISEDVGTYYCVVWASNIAIQSRVASLFLAGKNILKYMLVWYYIIVGINKEISGFLKCIKMNKIEMAFAPNSSHRPMI